MFGSGLVTVRKKVIFSHLSVSHSVHWGGGGGDTPGREPLKQAVRILLDSCLHMTFCTLFLAPWRLMFLHLRVVLFRGGGAGVCVGGGFGFPACNTGHMTSTPAPGGGCLQLGLGRPPSRNLKSTRYPSYWNVFLF